MEYMHIALREAEKAGARGDQPVGAVLVAGTDFVVGSNRIASSANPVLHAEVDAILRAVESGLTLVGARLFSTVESCYMCLGAILNAGISELIYGISLRDIHPEERFRARYGGYSCATMLELLGRTDERFVLTGGVDAGDCLAVWDRYRDAGWNAFLR
ncbi:nucleoside deaminase [Sphaerimonospora sp. CA-214678]|uniref:nucleoside deaminase n=1 Tax=Sphaerimonospora sp. CA-214678 TaxID=3240029 RepID=UPI003D8A913E